MTARGVSGAICSRDEMSMKEAGTSTLKRDLACWWGSRRGSRELMETSGALNMSRGLREEHSCRRDTA